MAYRHIVTDLSSLTQYLVQVNGNSTAYRVASANGVICFDHTDTGAYKFKPSTTYSVTNISNRHAALMAPAPGEDFIAPAELRLVASGLDVGRFGGPTGSDFSASKVEFFLNDTKIATVNDSDNYEYNVFKTRVTGIAAGSYQAWCRATYTDGQYLDSRPFPITVSVAPSYSSVVTLTGNVDWTGVALNYAGSSTNRIKIDGAGFKWTGNPTSITLTGVDLYNFGSTAGSTTGYGIDSTTTGTVSVRDCRFDGCQAIRFVTNGGSSVTFSSNLSRSNSRNTLGQAPDQSNSTANNNSIQCLEFAGNSTAGKVFHANNIGAGWVQFNSSGWQIGNRASSLANILQGPRVGFAGAGSFTGNVSMNYAHQLYYGGWSQGNNFSFLDVSSTLEHNVVAGGSWPIRGVEGLCQYNLVLGAFETNVPCEGLIWTHTGAANVHHNVGRAQSENSVRGMIYCVYASTGTVIRNNTLDGVDQQGAPLIRIEAGSSYVVDSNLLINAFSPAINVSTVTTVTADYNAFSSAAGVTYSDSRATPVHDKTGNPVLNAPPTEYTPFDLAAIWNRTKTVGSLLSDYRSYYRPQALVTDVGSTATYGNFNDIGAIGASSGTTNTTDLFGTLT